MTTTTTTIHNQSSKDTNANTPTVTQRHDRTSIAAGAPTLSKAETVFCGASAGVVSRFVIAPLDVVKIRLQMQTHRKDLPSILRSKVAAETALATGKSGIKDASSKVIQEAGAQPKYKGMFSGMAMIVREEGLRGLWKGNMAAEYLYLTYSGIQFLVYQQTKVFLNKTAQISTEKAMAKNGGLAVPLSLFSTVTQMSAVQSFISGANAGIVATACTYPFDLLRTRFAIQRDVKVYTGIIQACGHIYRKDGIKGFYRGMSPALIQVVPYMGIMFGSYDSLKHLVSWIKYKANIESSYVSPTDSSSVSPPPSTSTTTVAPKRSVGQLLLGMEDLLCGALSGIISKTGVYPLDMVRKRLQIQGSEQQKYSNATSSSSTSAASVTTSKPPRLPTTVWKCMVHIVKREGYLALYKGLLPGLLKAAPASAVTFLVFSQAGTFVEKFRRPQDRRP